MDSRNDEEAPLVLVSGENRKGRPGKSYTRDVHILSISFLLIFLAFGAAQNLETTINKVPSKFDSFPHLLRIELKVTSFEFLIDVILSLQF